MLDKPTLSELDYQKCGLPEGISPTANCGPRIRKVGTKRFKMFLLLLLILSISYRFNRFQEIGDYPY